MDTAGDDLAVLQYTSGTTRPLPAAVHHSHRSIVPLMVAAPYATGMRPGDRVFRPSSPAWSHGLWLGTLAPLVSAAMALDFNSVWFGSVVTKTVEIGLLTPPLGLTPMARRRRRVCRSE